MHHFSSPAYTLPTPRHIINRIIVTIFVGFITTIHIVVITIVNIHIVVITIVNIHIVVITIVNIHIVVVMIHVFVLLVL